MKYPNLTCYPRQLPGWSPAAAGRPSALGPHRGRSMNPFRGQLMKFKFHHMNLCTDSLPRLTKFYQTLFDLGTIQRRGAHGRQCGSSDRTGYSGKVDFLSDGAIEFHWAERDLDTGFKMKQIVNPMARGHFCFRTDDIKGFMRKCDELGHPLLGLRHVGHRRVAPGLPPGPRRQRDRDPPAERVLTEHPLPPSSRPRATRCRSTARIPPICGAASRRSETSATGIRYPKTCARS